MRTTPIARAALGLSCCLLLFTLGSCSHFLRTSSVRSTDEVVLDLAELREAHLIEGMRAAENLYLDPDSNRAYVTTLEGMIYQVDGDLYAVVSSLEVGGYALGIDRGPDGMLYVAVCPGSTAAEWKRAGGAIYRVNPALTVATLVTGSYPCMNGLAFDGGGNLFFASSNFSFFSPKGAVYRLTVSDDGTAGAVSACVPQMGLANGMYYDKSGSRVLCSDTLQAVAALAFDEDRQARRGGGYRLEVVYRKTALKEAFDDLCVDSRGRLWMTDPIRRTLRVYDPHADHLVRYAIRGFGQASSCRIRVEGGREVLYVTELVAPVKEKGVPYNGRGLLRLPLSALER